MVCCGAHEKTVQGQHFDAFCVLGKHVTCKSPWCVDEIWHARHFTLLLDLDCIARLYTRRSWLERSSCDSMAGFRSLCLYMFVCWNSVLTILIGTRRVNYYVKTLGLYWHRTWNSGVAACWAACFRGALCRMLHHCRIFCRKVRFGTPWNLYKECLGSASVGLVLGTTNLHPDYIVFELYLIVWSSPCAWMLQERLSLYRVEL